MAPFRRALALTASLAAAAAALGAAPPASAADPFAFTVIGDVPYGTTQTSQFPSLIDQINADPNVQLVSHLGDISSPLNCSTSYYSAIKALFDRFLDPMVYTPGDNEWTDCSRAATGAGNPLDRLAAVRAVFFPQPGTSLGQAPIAVAAQAGYPENVRFDQAGLSFAAVHAVGSLNDLAVWSGSTSVGTAQRAEEQARVGADVQLIHDTFAQAGSSGSRAVVLITQADMFISGQSSTYKSAFQAIVQAIAADSRAFGKPVFLINGDTHSYKSDKPLTSSSWQSYYATAAVPNLSRITIQGGTSEWTKFTVVDTSAVLSWQRVKFGATPPPPPANTAPSAAFTSSAAGLTATVDGSGSRDGDGTVTGYSWDFGDGGTGTGVMATHEYAAAGVYPVTLSVTDDDGATAAITQSVVVTDDSTPPPPSPAVHPRPGRLRQDRRGRLGRCGGRRRMDDAEHRRKLRSRRQRRAPHDAVGIGAVRLSDRRLVVGDRRARHRLVPPACERQRVRRRRRTPGGIRLLPRASRRQHQRRGAVAAPPRNDRADHGDGAGPQRGERRAAPGAGPGHGHLAHDDPGEGLEEGHGGAIRLAGDHDRQHVGAADRRTHRPVRLLQQRREPCEPRHLVRRPPRDGSSVIRPRSARLLPGRCLAGFSQKTVAGVPRPLIWSRRAVYPNGAGTIGYPPCALTCTRGPPMSVGRSRRAVSAVTITSLLGAGLVFVAASPASAEPGGVVISEINYHAPNFAADGVTPSTTSATSSSS
ncbi:PKD domain-containing protein [Naasia aerilata]|uniref:PKD domain-containing protein n=1 Tax=Naasia aerilata TaxID=1162966 RepID=A0ABN6XM01_9MICO|nr:PKD domain-containing protein [Naasia aerilata]BDZ45974.1 hypothetical protein GCM10025866_18830 [Naasia aerilata]